MITFDIFLLGLLAISTITGITTEAVKHVLAALKVKYNSNILSGIVAIILSAAVGIGYVILANVGFTSQSIISIVALAFMSWLCAMVGYDKVVQAITKFKNK